jgi:hypothetical protein
VARTFPKKKMAANDDDHVDDDYVDDDHVGREGVKRIAIW